MLKTPKYWKKKGLIALLLLPFSIIYFILHKFEVFMRILLETDVSSQFGGNRICVGNFTVGGSGKTPVVDYLAEEYDNSVIITKGYGGSNKQATVIYNENDTSIYGDEACMLSQNHNVIVGKDRYDCTLLAIKMGYSNFIYDDGLHDPRIHYHKTIEVLDDEYKYGNGFLLPAGPLRMIPFKVDEQIIIGKTHKFRPDYNSIDKTKKYIAFAGIGRPDKFFKMLENDGYMLTDKIEFADHYKYTKACIERLKKLAQDKASILITTEKDWVKIRDNEVKFTPIKLEKN